MSQRLLFEYFSTADAGESGVRPAVVVAMQRVEHSYEMDHKGDNAGRIQLLVVRRPGGALVRRVVSRPLTEFLVNNGGASPPLTKAAQSRRGPKRRQAAALQGVDADSRVESTRWIVNREW